MFSSDAERTTHGGVPADSGREGGVPSPSIKVHQCTVHTMTVCVCVCVGGWVGVGVSV